MQKEVMKKKEGEGKEKRKEEEEEEDIYSDQSGPMAQTRWPVLRFNCFYINQRETATEAIHLRISEY